MNDNEQTPGGSSGGFATMDEDLALRDVMASLFGAGAQDPEEGPKIGRYEVARTIGEGGMGRVFEAWDPQLERKVAVKLLHDEGVQRRLERESKAMARLNHPNVVTVFDVGVDDKGRSFVAMELVEGVTLRQWQKSTERSWREVLEMFRAIGRGIEAAHEAGLVHCDLKPENVLIGDDGRPRVTDFGIARLGVQPSESTPPRHISGSTMGMRSRIAGTPRYMSPEQFLGGSLDARSDQFSLCIMLWEAVYGELPFAGRSLHEIGANVTRGDRRPPPKGRAVPAWLMRTCARGLDPKPDRRWPTVGALLDALKRGRRRARRLQVGLALAGVGAVVGAVYGARALQRAQATAQCEEQSRAITEVWNAERSDEVRAAFARHDAAYLDRSATASVTRLDEQAQQWSDVSTRVCIAQRVEHRISDEQAEHARWCLRDRRLTFELIAEALTSASLATAQNAVPMTHNLGDLEECADPVHVGRQRVPPPGLRTQAEQVRRELVVAGLLTDAGRYPEAHEQAERALQKARAIDWPPLTARAAYRAGAAAGANSKITRGIALLEDAYFDAMRHELPEVAFRAAGYLSRIERDGGDTKQRGLWLRHAEFLLTLIEPPDEPPGLYTARLLEYRASHLQRLDQLEASIETAERSLELRLRLLGPEHQATLSSARAVASASVGLGQYDRARATHLDAVAQLESLLGPEHPALVEPLYDVAATYIEASRGPDARPYLERALRIHEASLDPDSTRVRLLSSIGSVYNEEGNNEVARKWHERAVAMGSRVLAPGDYWIAGILNNLANTCNALGDLECSEPALRRALEVAVEAGAPRFPMQATITSNLGSTLLNKNKLVDAKEQFEHSIALRQEALSPDHPRMLPPLLGLAEAQGRLGDLDGAEATLDRLDGIARGVAGMEEFAVQAELLRLRLRGSRGEGTPTLLADVERMATLPGWDGKIGRLLRQHYVNAGLIKSDEPDPPDDPPVAAGQ